MFNVAVLFPIRRVGDLDASKRVPRLLSSLPCLVSAYLSASDSQLRPVPPGRPQQVSESPTCLERQIVLQCSHRCTLRHLFCQNWLQDSAPIYAFAGVKVFFARMTALHSAVKRGYNGLKRTLELSNSYMLSCTTGAYRYGMLWFKR